MTQSPAWGEVTSVFQRSFLKAETFFPLKAPLSLTDY